MRDNRILEKKIVYKLGLFCNHIKNYNYLKYIVGKHGKECLQIDFRGEGWPGIPQIHTVSKLYNINAKHKNKFVWRNNVFMAEYCSVCNDFSARNADISFGDPWGIVSSKVENLGKTLVLVRNPELLKYLQDMDGEYVSIEPVRIEKVEEILLEKAYKKIKNATSMEVNKSGKIHEILIKLLPDILFRIVYHFTESVK